MSQDVVNKLLEELQKKVDEIQEIYKTLQTLKKYGTDFELPDLASLLKCDGGLIQPTNIAIRPDEFYGLTNTDAAEKYLQRIGHAMPLEDIYNALVQGGVQFSGEGKKSLYVQLLRGTRKFAKIGSGQGVTFGLLQWYPKRPRFIRQAPIKVENKDTGEKESQNEEPDK